MGLCLSVWLSGFLSISAFFRFLFHHSHPSGPPCQVPVEIRPNEIVSASLTPKLRLFKKDSTTGLKSSEVVTSSTEKLTMGSAVFLEADFEEAAYLAGVETGFSECIASTKADMTDNRVVLVR